MNILAIGAHPDDIEVSCAGTLLKYKAMGHNIFIALTTSGNQGSNTHSSREEIAEIREKEQLEAAKFYNAKVRFLRFDDQFLLDTPESRRAVLNAMRWAKPDVILTHHPEESSTDHAITSKLVSKLLLSLPGRLIPADEPPIQKFPSVFYWTSSGNAEVYVDISEVIDLKIKAISKHESQYAWLQTFGTEDFVENVKLSNQANGLWIGYKYAECFIPLRMVGFMPDAKLMP